MEGLSSASMHTSLWGPPGAPLGDGTRAISSSGWGLLVYKIWALFDHPNPFINAQQFSPFLKLTRWSNGTFHSDECKKRDWCNLGGSHVCGLFGWVIRWAPPCTLCALDYSWIYMSAIFVCLLHMHVIYCAVVHILITK